LNKTKSLSLNNIVRILAFSNISPHKEELLETTTIALKDAAQVGHIRRDLSKELDELSGFYPPDTCRRVIAELAFEQHNLLIKYHQNIVDLLNTEIPSGHVGKTRSLYASLENLCPNFKTFVSEYFHIETIKNSATRKPLK
jgi:hypothetical protein